MPGTARWTTTLICPTAVPPSLPGVRTGQIRTPAADAAPGPPEHRSRMAGSITQSYIAGTLAAALEPAAATGAPDEGVGRFLAHGQVIRVPSGTSSSSARARTAARWLRRTAPVSSPPVH
ncbi:hypothetical protein; putative signal peptide [Frankia alni ACN14a]|uniref:Uncharacterized protein n=1 Tax=Frankia alni (strain DSM 45986 / CECT 9034 / ACN14a) TaxID=326424 RepID=Q0RTC9_FRAAA|nr:hypothetical protein; putative signal peptide [Frankia alni ACN14a]